MEVINLREQTDKELKDNKDFSARPVRYVGTKTARRGSRLAGWAFALSSAALLLAAVGTYLAVNSAYSAWQMRTALNAALDGRQASLDLLMPLDADGPGAELRPAGNSQTDSGEESGLDPVQVDANRLFGIAPNMPMSEFASNGIEGHVWLAVMKETTYYRVGAVGLPAPAAGQSYQLWQMKGPDSPEAYLVGNLDYDPELQAARLSAFREGDWSDLRYMLLVMTEDNGTETILQELMFALFPLEADLYISAEAMEGSATTDAGPSASGDRSDAQALEALLSQGDLSGVGNMDNEQLLQMLLGQDISGLGQTSPGIGGGDLSSLLSELMLSDSAK